MALNVLGELAGQQGDDAVARALLQEELQIEERLADERAAGFTLLALRRIAHREGHEAEGQALNERALGIFRAIGDPVGLAGAVTGLGVYALTEGDLVAAREYFEEALSVRRHLPALVHLGLVAAEEEKPEEARQLFQEFLQLSRAPYDGILIEALEALAILAASDGRPARAFRLAGAAAGVGVPMSRSFSARRRSLLEQALASASTALDGPAGDAAWAEGYAMTPEQAIQAALRAD